MSSRFFKRLLAAELVLMLLVVAIYEATRPSDEAKLGEATLQFLQDLLAERYEQAFTRPRVSDQIADLIVGQVERTAREARRRFHSPPSEKAPPGAPGDDLIAALRLQALRKLHPLTPKQEQDFQLFLNAKLQELEHIKRDTPERREQARRWVFVNILGPLLRFRYRTLEGGRQLSVTRVEHVERSARDRQAFVHVRSAEGREAVVPWHWVTSFRGQRKRPGRWELDLLWDTTLQAPPKSKVSASGPKAEKR